MEIKSAQVAALVEDSHSSVATTRLARLLDFLGIPQRVFKNISQLAEAVENGSLRRTPYAVIAPLPVLGDLPIEKRQECAPFRTANSLFTYLTEDTTTCLEVLKALTACGTAELAPVQGKRVDVRVSNCCPHITGPLHGLQTVARIRPGDRILTVEQKSPILRIIESPIGAFFIGSQLDNLQSFISCSAEIPDIAEPLKGREYDVKDHFLSTVPLFMYLKWAFRNVCWHANEAGACLIIDDPILKTRYGFCDFRQLDAQTREYGFNANISVIPWNWRRTSEEMANLIRSSQGRLSISIHGCDHTAAEFATKSVSALNQKTFVAKRRMERHREKTGIEHDLIMVFPQGAFSRESFDVLQAHQFLAAVNTELSPKNEQDTLAFGDIWGMAILKYGNFPLFTRRYPAQGLENFAFDLLLGKPCLIVEHHGFFKDGGRNLINFVNALDSLNCSLQWHSLGEVIRRSYQWRISSEDVVEIRMFATELLLSNESGDDRSYQIQKATQGSRDVEAVWANGSRVEWETHNDRIMFSCKLGPRTEMLIQVQYRPTEVAITTDNPVSDRLMIAFRRYVSEFRDNFLSRHEVLMALAQKLREFAGRRSRRQQSSH
jgi:hypothetical protein